MFRTLYIFHKFDCYLTFPSFGDIYDPSKNPQGTEIKAITYSNMQIHIEPTRCDLFVIVDI
jgi:SHS2 domain-containing protein